MIIESEEDVYGKVVLLELDKDQKTLNRHLVFREEFL